MRQLTCQIGAKAIVTQEGICSCLRLEGLTGFGRWVPGVGRSLDTDGAQQTPEEPGNERGGRF
jgi:hypothetical protein